MALLYLTPSIERARSISPQKSSPANTPSPHSSRQSMRPNDGLKLEPVTSNYDDNQDTSRYQESDAMRFPSSSTAKENEDPRSGTSPTRSSTLSWQRRPPSRGAPGGSRPLSVVAAQNATHRSLTGSQEPEAPPQSATEEPTVSRDHIAQSLASKDPAWFRQTADRGTTSAAYRKNQVEDEDRAEVSSARAQLPGMSDSPKDRTISQSSAGTATSRSLASPLAPNPIRLEPQTEDTSEGLARSATGRVSPLRSTSPTKGMGGFVQSAMMKRSDSVKRWSVQSPPGLARVDTVTSNRSSMYVRDPPQSIRPPSTTRIGSTTPSTSRPASQLGDRDVSHDATPKASTAGSPTEDQPPIPTSPSKTMDPRRWSPTKASWLDSALNRPDSPKPELKPHTPTQPAWMAELNKKKHNPAGDGSPSVSHKHQVSIGGLMRSSPMGAAAKTNTTGLGGIYSPPAGGNRPPLGHGAKSSISIGNSGPSPTKSDYEATEEKETDRVEVKTEVAPKPLESSRPSMIASPPPLKPKPDAQIKDFRSNLKQRSGDSGPPKTAEPEFKNVFGNLRRTKTQNYVAPDELKSNILRGKAALAATGGPQKSERKDEFKESILQKKDSFKKAQAEGKGVTRSQSINAPKPVPEGLKRRTELGRINTGSKREASSDATPGPVIKSPKSATFTDQAPRALPGLQGRVGGGKLADRFNPALAGMLARGPPPMATDGGKRSEDISSGGSPSNEPSKPGPQLTHMTKGRARGPRRKAPTTVVSPLPEQPKIDSEMQFSTPKREERSVSMMSMASSLRPSASSEDVRADAEPAPASIQSQAAARAALMNNRPQPADTVFGGERDQLRSSLFRRPTNPEPTPPFKPQKIEGVELTSPLKVQKIEGVEPTSPLKADKTGGETEEPSSPKKLNVKRMSRFLAENKSNGNMSEEPAKLTHQRTGSRSPSKITERPLPEPVSPAKTIERPSSKSSERPSPSEILELSSPTKVDTEHVASVKSATSRFGAPAPKPQSPPPGPKPKFDSIGSRELPNTSIPQAKQSRPSPTPLDAPASRPLPTPSGPRALTPVERSPIKKSDEISVPPSGPRSLPPAERSPIKQSNEISVLLTDFFGPQRPHRDYKVDPAQVIMQRPYEGGKIRSLGCQMFQISGDGKKVPVLSHYERTLFEREMYIVAHEFQDESRRRGLEVYFWVGDEVPESTAEDAQLFAVTEARFRDGKLVKLRQGKETPEFLQALGGTVITRRSSSNKYDSIAPSMLCGRRHFGQVVFDEVDFTPSSLCAGFPYLITQAGKCHLWKGRGSNVDELSCARLVGMDLTLTGELFEYDEGSESEGFWAMFGGSKERPHSADHWKLKPAYAKYCSRLFCSDAEAKEQVTSPFPTFFVLSILIKNRSPNSHHLRNQTSPPTASTS